MIPGRDTDFGPQQRGGGQLILLETWARAVKP